MSYARIASTRRISILLLIALALATITLIAASSALGGAAQPTFISPGGCGSCAPGHFGPSTQHDA